MSVRFKEIRAGIKMRVGEWWKSSELKEKAKHILDVQLSDTLKAHRLLEDGTYQKVDRRGKEAIEAQKTFCEEAIAAANESKKKVPKKRTFDPRFSPQEE